MSNLKSFLLVESAKSRGYDERRVGTCGYCSRSGFLLTNKQNHLSKHGFRRPGWGSIAGECPGSHMTALEFEPITLELLHEDMTEAVYTAEKNIRVLKSYPETLVDYGVTIRIDGLSEKGPVTYKKDSPEYEKRRLKVLAREEERLAQVKHTRDVAKRELAEWKPATEVGTRLVGEAKKQHDREQAEAKKRRTFDTKKFDALAKFEKKFQSLLKSEAEYRKKAAINPSGEGAGEAAAKAHRMALSIAEQYRKLDGMGLDDEDLIAALGIEKIADHIGRRYFNKKISWQEHSALMKEFHSLWWTGLRVYPPTWPGFTK